MVKWNQAMGNMKCIYLHTQTPLLLLLARLHVHSPPSSPGKQLFAAKQILMNLIWTLLTAFLQRNQNIKLLYRSEFLDHQET